MKINKILFLAAALSFSAAAYAQPQAAPAAAPAVAQEESFTGKIFTAKGVVELQKAGSSDWTAVKAPLLIAEGDKVKTGPKSKAEIYMRHGVKVRLEAGSTFVLNSASKENGSVEVLVGKMQAWVRKLAGRKLSVRTPTAVCAIRGTTFEVEVAETGETAWNLFNGSLEVASSAGGNTVMIAPGQRAVVTKDAGVAAPVPLPAEIREPSEPAKTKEEKEEIKAEQQAAKAEQKAAAEADAKAKAEADAKAKAEAEAKAKAEADAKAKAEAEAAAKTEPAPIVEEAPAVTQPETTVIQTQIIQESCEVSGSTPGCN